MSTPFVFSPAATLCSPAENFTGLQLKFEFALHPASAKNPAGRVEPGFNVLDLEAFYGEMSEKGVLFCMPPTKQDFGGVLAQFIDCEGAHCSVDTAAS
jgi:predicted enzyme related to lactoylglutathione lyase